LFKPEYDMAVLEIDPQINEGIAEKLHLKESKPLTLSFDSSQRSIGSPVTWLTTAAQGDLTLTPRLFTVHTWSKRQSYSELTHQAGHRLCTRISDICPQFQCRGD
jgi:hypothetical protein